MRFGEEGVLASEADGRGDPHTARELGAWAWRRLRGIPDEPPPRDWLVPGVIPCGPRARRPVLAPWRPVKRGYVTGVAAARGTGKSYLLLYLALCLLTGRPWLGLPVRKVDSVLWTDFELDADEFWARAYALARGMGLPGGVPPAGLHYLNLCGQSLAVPSAFEAARGARAEGQRRIRAEIRRHRVKVVLNDSLTLGGGVALSDPAGWGRLLRAMEAWGVPCVTIDHTGKKGQGGMIGSFAKEGLVRAVLTFERLENGKAVRITHSKANFGSTLDPFTVAATFVKDPWGRLVVVYTPQSGPPATPVLAPEAEDEDDGDDAPEPTPAREPTPAPAPEPAPVVRPAAKGGGWEALDAAVLAAFRAHDRPVSHHEVAEAIGYKPTTVANACTRLKKARKLANPERGKWVAVREAGA